MVAPLFPPLSAISRRKYGGGKPPPINSWPTAGAPAALSPFLPEAPSPLPFPLEDPPQSLTARRAAKPLASAVTGAYEPHFASWAFAAKKIGIACWGMTLASMRRRRAGRHRRCGNCYLGFGHLGFGRLGFGHLGFGHLGFGRLGFGLGGKGGGGQPALGAPASIPLALDLPFLPRSRFLAMFSAVTFIPPSPGRLTALGTAIPGLGMGGAKWFFAVFEQTRSLARPTSPLTFARFTRC